MTSSRSRTSTSSVLALLALLAAWIVLIPGTAAAERKRVVVLELEGSKAEKFHSGLVKLVKKEHTVVPLDKWIETAEELGATGTSAKDLKKVAKKLKVDAIVTGKVDKRRDEYILRIKVRAGKTGDVLKPIEGKFEDAKIAGSAKGDLRDELLPVIADAPSNRGGGGGDDEDGEDRPKKKPVEAEDDEEEDAPKKGFGKKPEPEEAVARPKKPKKPAEDEDTAAALRTRGDDDEDDAPLPKPKKPKKPAADEEEGDDEGGGRVAARGDDEGEEGGEVEEEYEEEGVSGADALTPGERAVDLAVGLSFTARRMKFNYEAGLANEPAPYSGVPVAGALIDATVYPLAFGHKRSGMAKNFGLTFMLDKVLVINSKQELADGSSISFPTSQMRYAVGLAFRYPLGKLTVGLNVRYGKQSFTIDPADGMDPAIPSVAYSMIDPNVTFRYQAGAKLVIGANLGTMLISNTGPIQDNMNYGAATVSGFQGELGVDYLLTEKLFLRGAFRFSTIGFTFKGGGNLSNNVDSDAEQDVFGARDTYLGGALTAGYLL